eukprot:scaffold7287_cov95-Isochrysis_galbana.AAC.1
MAAAALLDAGGRDLEKWGAAGRAGAPGLRLWCRWEQVCGVGARFFDWRVAKVADGHGGAACGRGRDLKAWRAAGSAGGSGSRWQPRPEPQGGGWGAGGSRWIAWARALLRLARGRGSSWPRRLLEAWGRYFEA